MIRSSTGPHPSEGFPPPSVVGKSKGGSCLIPGGQGAGWITPRSLTGITVSLFEQQILVRYLSDSSERERLHSAIDDYSSSEILLVSEIVQYLISPYIIILLSMKELIIKGFVS